MKIRRNKKKKASHKARPTLETNVLQDSMRQRKEMERLFRVLEISDRVIAGRNLRLTVVSTSAAAYSFSLPDAPAWTDGVDIWIHGDKALAWKGRTIVDWGLSGFVASAKGLNYHELAHIIFTPRVSDPLSKRVITNGSAIGAGGAEKLWWCYNALEDQRAEMMFGAEYSLAYEYFKASNLNYILRAKGQTFDTLLPLQHGRLFLPVDLRMKLQRLFANVRGQSATDEVIAVIDEYITLVHTFYDHDDAMKLIRRLYDALFPKGAVNEGINPQGSHYVMPSELSTVKEDNQLGRGKAEDGSSVAEAVAEAVEADQQERESMEENLDEDGQPEEGEPDEPEESEGQDESTGPTFDERNPMDTPDPEKWSKELAEEIEEMKDEAEAALGEVLSSSKVAADLDRTIKAAKASGAGEWSPDIELDVFSEWEVTQDMLVAKQRLVPVLRNIKLDLESHWMRKQPSGRLDPYAAMVSEVDSFDMDVFDRWDEGAEAEGGVELVLLIDQSSSMGKDVGKFRTLNPTHNQGMVPNHGGAPRWTDGAIVPASQAVWVLYLAFSELDVRVTVIGFNSRHQLLIKPEEQLSLNRYRLFTSTGGTHPGVALSDAWGILRDSQVRHRMLCIVTDGEWAGAATIMEWSGGNSDEIIESMNLEGIHTTLLGLDAAVDNHGEHNCLVALDIDDPMGIVDVMGESVQDVMKRASYLHTD